jgi:hypothetical protein
MKKSFLKILEESAALRNELFSVQNNARVLMKCAEGMAHNLETTEPVQLEFQFESEEIQN